jgi:nucleotide-binding universal stress UspA family protein
MIKDIVVNLSVAGSRASATDYAVSVGDAFGAHVAGVAFAYEPVIPATIMGGVPAELIEAQRSENSKAAKAALDHFDKAATRAGISAESRALSAGVAGAADMFARIARRFDLAIVGQAEPDKYPPEDLIVEGALFEAGRPVIVVPYIQRGGLKLDRVMACWDGSRPSARAIADAMPLLQKAKNVQVVIVANERGKQDEVPGADMGQHLARHGLKVEVKRITAGDVDVGNTLLSHAADSSADFIVMGGYGHSRLREFVLGGVTRTILSAMTVPALMSH